MGSGHYLQCVNGCGCFGGQTAGGHPQAFPRPRQPLFAVPALRELKGVWRGEHFVRCCHSAHSLLHKGFPGGRQGGLSSSCDPNPACPFARFRHYSRSGRSFLLTVSFFCSQLVFVAYGKLASSWSSLLTVEIRLGLSCLWWKIGLIFYLQFPLSGNWVWSFYLLFPLSGNWVWSSAYDSPCL